jgi:hypothetical protein
VQTLGVSSGAAAPNPPADSALDDLFAAFEPDKDRAEERPEKEVGAGWEGVSETEGRSSGKTVAKAVTADDVFSDFGFGGGKRPGEKENTAEKDTSEKRTADLSELLDAVKERLKPSNSSEIRFAAALVLLRAGDRAAVPFVSETFGSRTSSERVEIAQSLARVKGVEFVTGPHGFAFGISSLWRRS